MVENKTETAIVDRGCIVAAAGLYYGLAARHFLALFSSFTARGHFILTSIL